MTARALITHSRTTLTGTWLLAIVLMLAPALSDVCAAMCAMPMTMTAAMNADAPHHGAVTHQGDDAAMKHAGRAVAATRNDGAAHQHTEHAAAPRGVPAHHEHCDDANTSSPSPSQSPTPLSSSSPAPFALQAAHHHCVLHASTTPSSADENRTLAVRAGAMDESVGALATPPAVAALTFDLVTASARSAPLPALTFTSGLASARPLRVPLRI